MRIRRPAPDILIASDSAHATRVVGALVALSGAALAYIAARGALAHSWGVIVLVAAVGVTLVVLGLASARGTGSHTLTFDRPRGIVHLTRRHLVGATIVLHRITDVADAVLERLEVDDDQVERYRPALVMRDGTHRYWGRATASRGHAAHVAGIEAIREFLGTAGRPAAPDGTPAFPRPGTSPRGWAVLPAGWAPWARAGRTVARR